MTRLFRRTLTAVLVASLFAAAANAQQASHQAKLKEHFLKGMVAFENGRYKVAVQEFEEVLKLDPSSQEALELRDLADARFFIQVLTKGKPEMRRTVLKLLQLAAEADKQRLTDKDLIDGFIKDLVDDEFAVRKRAYIKLISAGRYAVPGLLRRLAETKAPRYQLYRVRSTVALIRIGEEAVLPLSTALRTDQTSLRQDICFILGEIADPRSAPYLLRAAKQDPGEIVRTVAIRALTRLREGVNVTDEPAHVALFKYARLYYYEDPSIQRSSKYGDATWAWSADQGTLVMQTVPDYLYNVNMARQIAAEALLANPQYEPVLPLLVSTYHKEIQRIRRRLEAGKTLAGQKLSELEENQLRARLTRSENVLLTLRSAGEKHFYRALALQLRDGAPELAAAVIEDLATIAKPELNLYPELPELFAPIRPTVYRTPAPAEEEAPTDKPETRTPTAAAPKVAKPPSAATATVDPDRLFGLKVRAEKKSTEPAVRTTRAKTQIGPKGTPSEHQALYRLIMEARAELTGKRPAAAPVREPEKGEATQVATLDTNPLIQALKAPDKGVRYGAAAALARIDPTKAFAASKAVVHILGQAITEKGVSTVLVVSKDSQATNRLRAIVRNAGHVPYSASSMGTALTATRALPPKDLVLLENNMIKTFEALKKDPAVAGIPVIIFVRGKDTSGAEKDFAGQAAAVISIDDKSEKITAELARVILGRRTKSEGLKLSAEYARVGARALASIPERDSPFSPHLADIKDALIAALDGDDPEVRISAIGTLGKARIKSLMLRLIDISQAEDRAQAERLACIEAVGKMIGPKETPPQEAVNLLIKIHRTGNPALRRVAVRHLLRATLPPDELEKLISAQEAAPAEAPAVPVKEVP